VGLFQNMFLGPKHSCRTPVEAGGGEYSLTAALMATDFGPVGVLFRLILQLPPHE